MNAGAAKPAAQRARRAGPAWLLAGLFAWAGSAAADPLVQDTALDAAFGTAGRKLVPIDLRPGHDLGDLAVADGLGGVWIAGRAEIAGGSFNQRHVLAVARVERDGSLGALVARQDVAWWRDVQEGPVFLLEGLAADEQGRALVLVQSCTNQLSADSCSSRVLRLARDGSPDMSFDADGEISAPMMQRYLTAVAAGPDGEVWTSGSESGAGSRLYRHAPGGAQLDSVALAAGAVAFATLPDGKRLALHGASQGAAALSRLGPEGTPDRSFGADGRLVLAQAAGHCGRTGVGYQPRAVAAAADGRAVVLVDLLQDNDPVQSLVIGVGRDGTTGTPVCIEAADPSIAGTARSAGGIALRDDGRAFVALYGIVGPNGEAMGLAGYRLGDDGQLAVDPQFNGGARLAVPFARADGRTDALATQVVLDRGAPILAGAARVDGAGYDFAAVRLLGSSRVFRAGFD